MTESLRNQITMAEAMLRDTEDRIGKFRGLGEQLASVVGRGEAAGGKVVAEWSSGALTTLEYDPTVMRMASVDLAAATKEAVSAAIRDHGARTRDALTKAGVEPGRAATPEQLRERLAEVRRQFTSAGRQAADGIDDANRRLSR